MMEIEMANGKPGQRVAIIKLTTESEDAAGPQEIERLVEESLRYSKWSVDEVTISETKRSSG